MRGKTIKIFLLALLAFPPAAHAKIPAPTHAESAFAKNYLKALRTHDAALLESLVDPQSVACIKAASNIWFDQTAHILTTIHGLKDDQIAHDPAVTFGDFTTPFLPGLFFPDPPEKTMILKWTPGKGQSQQDATYQIGIIENKQGIFQALPCPTAEDIKRRDASFESKGYKPPAK